MTNEIYEKTEYLINRWWLSLLSGIVVIAIGFIILVNPTTSYYTFALLLGIAILLSGIMTLVQSLSSHNYFVRRVWLFLASIIDIVIGIMLMMNTLLSEAILPLLAGFWLMYRGCAILAQGIDLRGYGKADAGWIIFYGILVIVLSIAIIWMPTMLGAETVVIFIAVGALSYGVSLMTLGFRLWEVHRHARALGSDE